MENWKFSIRSIFLLAFLTISFFFSASFYFFYKSTFSVRAQSLSSDVIRQVNETIIQKTANFLMPAIFLSEISSRLITSDVINTNEINKLESYYISIMKSHHQINKFYYGNKAGDFVMVSKKENNRYETRIQDNMNQSYVKIFVKNQYEKVLSKNYLKTTYNHRTRSWYIGAKKSNERFWTDVYLFFSDKKPGITASYPVYDDKNNFKGVFGLDISLERLSTFLETESKPDNAKLLLLNANNRVIAQTGELQFKKLKDGNIELFHVQQLNDPLFKFTYNEYLNTLSDRFDFNYEGKRYYASFADFPHSFGQKWKIIMVIPEQSFFGKTSSEAYKLSVLFSVLFLVAIFMAFTISFILIVAISNLNKKIKGIYSGESVSDMQGSMIKELDDLFKSMKRAKNISNNNQSV